ncbi:MAG: hypothetical protein HUJ83_10640 [Veillonella sp.]|nr:hypothetical protein [Veillonella sp.]
MNQPSEQLTAVPNIVIDYDQPLSLKELRNTVMECLGAKCTLETLYGKKLLVYRSKVGPKILLCKNITYLGNPHPIFKKRIQIPAEWIDLTYKLENDGYDVHFIGVYHYDGLVVFADFVKYTYLQRNCHNSAAHIYINDLYQAVIQGAFEKEDKNDNTIRVISYRKFGNYLNGELKINSNLLDLFAQFNYGFSFGKWLKAVDCIQEMHDKHWSQWKQAEWAGWFLEYKFSNYVEDEEVAPYIKYTALSHKGHKDDKLDFDLWFPLADFYGDLKASDIKETKAIGNDQETFCECINRYGRFWYVIYEHETEKDSDHDYEATLFWNKMLGKDDSMSYCTRMKHSVNFKKMFIIEINRINFYEILSSFNQGRQPSGEKRNPKFTINKRNIDNYVVYRYNYKQ